MPTGAHGALTQRFEEPGALEHVAELAAKWFRRWLARVTQARAEGEKRAG